MAIGPYIILLPRQ